MESNEIKCNKLAKVNILHRASLRGLKRCQSCGTISGLRAVMCRNDNCDLRKKMLAAVKPYDPIQLITRNSLRLFSLKTRDKLTNVRNFVRLKTEYPAVPSTTSGGKTECYVDSCKYDPSSMAATGCRHIKACRVASDIPKAEVYPLDMSVLWNLNLAETQKQHLWDLYECDRENVQPIQRLDAYTFVVVCDKTKNFTAGLLHVTVVANSVAAANKRGFYSCACKKLKIVVDADNSVIMKKEICDHILLVIAAILHKPDGKTMYADFLESVQYLWMPKCLNLPVELTTGVMDIDEAPLSRCENMTSKIDNIVGAAAKTPDDIFKFSEEIFTESSIPDFSDILPHMPPANLSSINTQVKEERTTATPALHIKDAKLNFSQSTINDDDFYFNFSRIDDEREARASTPIQAPICFNENSLSVLEKFQLDDDLHVSNDNIALAKEIEIFNELQSEVSHFVSISQKPQTPQPQSLLKSQQQKPEQSLNTNINTKTNSTSLPLSSIIIKPSGKNIFLNKSVIVKQSPVKIIKITAPGVIHKLPKIDKKFIQISKIDSSKLVVLNPKTTSREQRPICVQPLNSLSVTSTVPSPPVPEELQQQPAAFYPSLSYESWLDHIIEILNDSIILQDSNNIKHTFHVHEQIFSHFSKTFGFNNGRRQPNSTSLIKSGKYKDLIKNTWYFNQAAAVTRIFSTKNSKLELQRSSERLKEGSFVPFFNKLSNEITVTHLKPIQVQPKVPENRVFLKFSNTPESALDKHECDKTGLKLEWLPSAFPKSNFGLMTIEFCVYTYTKN